jgi:hypothetical protein
MIVIEIDYINTKICTKSKQLEPTMAIAWKVIATIPMLSLLTINIM